MHSMGGDVAAFDAEVDGDNPPAPIHKARVEWDGALPVIPSWADQLLLAAEQVKKPALIVGQPKPGSVLEKILALITAAGEDGLTTGALGLAARAALPESGETVVNNAVSRLRQLRLITSTRAGNTAIHRARRGQ